MGVVVIFLKAADEIRFYVFNRLKTWLAGSFLNSSNSVFAIGAYQSVALNPAVGATPFTEAEITDAVNRTAAKFPNHGGVANFKKNLAQLLPRSSQAAAPAAWMNKPAPDFTLPAADGATVSLSSLRGKYVLVDFWASWCRPCRAENPNVVKAYQKFKDKNFTVLGVSLDQEKTDWLDAIKKDNLTWTQVSDLKFWESKVVPLYNIEGIPYNVLVDPNGTVIGEGLRGEDLEKKLQEVLK